MQTRRADSWLINRIGGRKATLYADPEAQGLISNLVSLSLEEEIYGQGEKQGESEEHHIGSWRHVAPFARPEGGVKNQFAKTEECRQKSEPRRNEDTSGPRMGHEEAVVFLLLAPMSAQLAAKSASKALLDEG